jgi:hypothetical protein
MEYIILLLPLGLIVLCLWLIALTIRTFINKKMVKAFALFLTTALLGAVTVFVSFYIIIVLAIMGDRLSQKEFIKMYEGYAHIEMPSDSSKIKSYRARRGLPGDWHGMLKFNYKNPNYFNQLQIKHNSIYTDTKLEITKDRIGPRFSEGNDDGEYNMPRGSYAAIHDEGSYYWILGIDPNNQTVYFHYESW